MKPVWLNYTMATRIKHHICANPAIAEVVEEHIATKHKHRPHQREEVGLLRLDPGGVTYNANLPSLECPDLPYRLLIHPSHVEGIAAMLHLGRVRMGTMDLLRLPMMYSLNVLPAEHTPIIEGWLARHLSESVALVEQARETLRQTGAAVVLPPRRGPLYEV